MKNFLTELVLGSVFFATEMFKQRLRINILGKVAEVGMGWSLEGINISYQLQDSKVLVWSSDIC